MIWSKNNKTQIGLELTFLFEKDVFFAPNSCLKPLYVQRTLHNGEQQRSIQICTGMIETESIVDATTILLQKYNQVADELGKLEHTKVVFCIIPVVENDRKPCIDIEGELKALVFSFYFYICIDYYYVT